jgi:predicted lipoprotein
MNPTRRELLALTALATALAACGENSPSTQSRVLGDLVRVVLIPAWEAVSARADALVTACEALRDSPSDTTLGAAQDAWREAHRAVRVAAVLRAGPYATERFEGAADYFAFSQAALDRALANAPAMATEDYVDTVGSNAKGLPALERLLFLRPVDNAALRATLHTLGAPTPRCHYAVAAARFAATAARRTHASWRDRYGAQLRNAGAGSTEFTRESQATTLLFNELVKAIDALRFERLLVPFGSMNGGTPLPEAVEAPLSDRSLDALRDGLRGAEALYAGRLDAAQGLGLSAVVAASGAALDATVRADFARCTTALAAVPAPLRTAVTDARPAVQAAVDALLALRTRFTTDVFGLLGIQSTFSDRDGD